MKKEKRCPKCKTPLRDNTKIVGLSVLCKNCNQIVNYVDDHYGENNIYNEINNVNNKNKNNTEIEGLK